MTVLTAVRSFRPRDAPRGVAFWGTLARRAARPPSLASYPPAVDPAELLRRIQEGEDSTLECKSVEGGALKAEHIGRTLCAFANTAGGDLVLGVEDDGRVSGIGGRERANELQRQVSQVAQNTEPSVFMVQRVVHIGDAPVLVVHVRPHMAGRPFLYQGHCFVRDGNRTRQATHSEMARLFVSGGGVYFDEEPIDETSLDDLDHDTAVSVLGSAYREFKREDLNSYLAALQAISDSHLTVGGALMFTRSPDKWLPGAEIHALRLPGTEIGTTTLANERFGGPLSSQIAHALGFIRAHVLTPSSRESTERAPTGPVVDEAVWVEALTNAVSHRDYRSRISTRLLVLDDRVELINPGDLLNKLTVEGIQKGGVSQLRNPHIARVLSLTRGRDNAALGVPEIMRRVRNAGLPEPEIDVSQGAFRLVVRTRRPT